MSSNYGSGQGSSRGGVQRGRGQRGGSQRGGHRDGGSGFHQRGHQENRGGDRARDSERPSNRGFSGRGSGFGGDDRGRSRGRGQAVSVDIPVKHNIRKLCSEAEAVDLKIDKTQKGNVGKEVELITNHYQISFDEKTCYQYDIELRIRRNDGKGFIPIGGDKENKLKREQLMENIEVIKKLAKEWTEVFGEHKYIFDGNKNIHTVEKLAIADGQQLSRDVSVQLDGRLAQIFEVKIQFSTEVLLSNINDYYNGLIRDPIAGEFRDSFQVLETFLRYNISQERIPVGNNLYGREYETPIEGHNAMIRFGHEQSLQMTEVGLTLNVNTRATIFRSDGTLVEFIAKELGITTEQLKRTQFGEREIRELNKKINGLKIFTKHVKNMKMKKFIDKMVNKKVNEEELKIDRKDAKGKHIETVVLTIEQYLKDTYKLNIEYRNIPLILMKGPKQNYLPASLCYVYPDQPMPKKLINDSSLKETITKVTADQNPELRFSLIQEGVEAISDSINKNDENNVEMNMFGLQIKLNPIKLKARVLKEPQVEGNSNKLKVGSELNYWFFVNISGRVERNLKNLCNDFFNELIRTGEQIGVKIAKPKADSYITIQHNIEAIDSTILDLKKNNPKLQMIFFCLPPMSDFYSYIKFYGDIIFGVMTQCVKDDNFISKPKNPKGYFQNFLLKTNAKLNGCNQSLSLECRPHVLLSPKPCPTMIVGVDVTHPGTSPLANEKVISSIASCVGTYDALFTKYSVSISVQPKNKELIENFGLMIGELLEQFVNPSYNRSQFPPQSIVVFRDGVSEGQFSQVMDEEIPQITQVFQKRFPKSPVPKITVFIVQKRHHTRFMPFVQKMDRRGNPVKNCEAGTVVDHTIVNPFRDEFHLTSHNGMLGLSRHSKYVVLRDDHKMTKNNKEMLSYYLCYAYNRCLKPISIPTPVMYAHLAAFRSKQHIAAQNIDIESKIKGETTEQKADREARNIAKLNAELKYSPDMKMKILPYYC